MLSLSKKFLLICNGRNKILKRIIVNGCTQSKCSRCLTCTTQFRTKSKSSTSLLFTPVPVKIDDNTSPAGEELSGKLDKTKLVKIINAFYRKPELQQLAEENGLDSEFSKICLFNILFIFLCFWTSCFCTLFIFLL